MNTIAHVASEQVRRVVMGYDSATRRRRQELKRMTDLVARSMQEGAWGLVTRFESGGPEHPDEIIAMAKIVASYGGNYTSHIGSEGFEQTKEIAFADPRRGGGEDSGPHLPFQDSRQGKRGHDRALHPASRGMRASAA